MNWLDALLKFWPQLVAGLGLLAAALTSIHVILNKRDSRAASLWLGFVWLLPLLGTVLYLMLGINRIRRHAQSLRANRPLTTGGSSPPPDFTCEPEQLDSEHLRQLARVVNRVATRPLTSGNRVQPLINGDEAFPAMLKAIDDAKVSVALATYIFDNDATGRRFVEALRGATRRGVQVRVLVDDAGARYSWPSIFKPLKRAGIRYARFLPTLAPWRLSTMNLHNHRKLLVVDGRIGFTGGINIRNGNLLREQPRSPVQELHFKVEGPVVAQLQETFANDWAFCTREVLEGATWFGELGTAGKVIARVVTDGPDADFEKARWTMLGALSCAKRSVRILTPYFLPDQSLVTALNLAALQGVEVDIILPGVNNLPFIHWASRAMWWQVLERGCRIWLTSPPFDHSKLMVVDEDWVFLGSANWDPRSLRLNFELNLECYDTEFARRMESVVQNKLRGAHQVTLAEVDQRPMLQKLRDGFMRLFSPYL